MFRFEELAQRNLTDQKKVVVSRRSDGYISVAQRVPMEVEDGTVEVFLKNAIVVPQSGLLMLKQAIDEAVSKL